MKLFTIPNLFTLGNLFCGCLGIVFAFQGDLVWTAYLVGIAAVLDFLDGFVARLLKSHSPIGKELDSLADMVTFGVLPGIVAYRMIQLCIARTGVEYPEGVFAYLPFIAFLIPLFSGLRLAKFNVDTRQSDSFIGVPTPANAILICSIPLILGVDPMFFMGWYHPDLSGPENEASFMAYLDTHPAVAPGVGNISYWDVAGAPKIPLIEKILLNVWLHVGISVVMSLLLISEIPLFALKFKNFGWKGNEIRYIFLGLSVALFIVLKFVGIPLVIVLYILLSLVNNLLKKKEPAGN
ncbi:MAG: phosphatidylserine synthase [Bacteroidetes bacterium]|nr:MAG: phosphatidylserine synthase [Bacteroidota bacterium]